MPSHYWIKLYHEILDDPKMGRLPDRLWRRAIELFLLAGEMHNSGDLPSVVDMAWKLRTTKDELMEDLLALGKVGIATLNDNGWHIVNFSKRQAAVDNAQWQRQYRNKQRMLQDNIENVTEEKPDSNESITNCNADIDTDIDTEEKKNMETPSAADAPAPKQKRKAKTSKPKTPEAVKVFRENAHRYPPKAWYAKIADAVGEKPVDLEFWGQVVLAYVGLGWNPGNVKNMLAYYEKREIPATKGQQKASGLEPHAGIRQWLADEGVQV